MARVGTRLSTNQGRLLVFLGIFVLIGITALLLTHAASLTSSHEAETGTVQLPARVVADSQASNASALKFGSASSTATGITVSGNKFLKDGAAFTPHGFNMVGILAPPGCSANGTAKTHFGTAEFTAARDTWHANTLRFQVSQSGLAGSSSAAYISSIKTGVAQAHALGLVVIVSMQDQSLGCGPAHPLPNAQTVTAWDNLAPQFKNDPYTILELFNEPTNNPDTAGWAQWQNGGSTPDSNQGSVAVGHQQLVNEIRSLGVNNVLLADGASHAEVLTGMPMLTDTLAQPKIGYVTHPYYFELSSSQLDSRFGYLAATKPMVADEWNYMAADCGTVKETDALGFLTYLQNKNIGVLGHALDAQVGNAIIADWNYNPTNCSGSIKGSGAPFLTYSTSFPATPTNPL